MSRPTRSELQVLDALADELGYLVPDMPGQIAEALVGVRRNTGTGYTAEIIVDRSRPLPLDGPTGALGTVHGDIAGVIEPVAFQALFTRGRLTGLQASTYEESTVDLDLQAPRIVNIFRIDDDGRSVAWEPTMAASPGALLKLQEPPGPRYAEPEPEPALVNVGAVQRVQATGPAATTLDTIFGKRPENGPEPEELDAEDLASVRVGLVATYVAFALIAVFIFDVSPFFLIFAGVIGANLLKNRTVLTTAKRAFDRSMAAAAASSERARRR